jgi:hypothetical protein
MARGRWLFAVPVLAVIGFGGKSVLAPSISRGADRRILSEKALDLEAELGYHLYAPTWLPNQGSVGTLGALKGAKRILQDFTDKDGRALLILSLEPRCPERDRYHQAIFEKRADARGDVNGKRGYFVTGSGGERRLFWNEDKMAVIVSSCVLTDEDLLKIAQKVQ